MPTKAELERQVKSLKLELANALAETRGTPDEEAAEVTELRQRNESLCTQLSELQAQLELEKSARQQRRSQTRAYPGKCPGINLLCPTISNKMFFTKTHISRNIAS